MATASDLRPLRAFSIDKARNLFASAQTALRDARAPAQFISAQRRFDAAYDCGLHDAVPDRAPRSYHRRQQLNAGSIHGAILIKSFDAPLVSPRALEKTLVQL